MMVKSFPWIKITDWLTVVAMAAWGALLINFWISGRLGILIHPNYFALTVSGGFFMVIVALFQGLKLLRQPQGVRMQHFSFLSPQWLSVILLVSALVGFLVPLRPFASQTAIQRGLQDTTVVTRANPQAFRTESNPESRSLLEWVRTLDVYPEPDAYQGQKVNVEGFVVYPENLAENYLTLARFAITCCAADAYPIGLPVKLKQTRQEYAVDQCFVVKGHMQTETLDGKRQLVIVADSLSPIPEPKNPYSY
ncbi:MAG: TIGR03943 family protein [Thermosynechococcaceae cyanobacterium]